MRLTRLPLTTLKESPADAVIPSHRLMLRAGLVRKLAAGLYSWMPVGLRVIRKVERIVREEMDRAGAFELLMPSIQPAELWQESKRWEKYGPELLRLQDRNGRDFCYGPTHEEVITDIVRREIRSYKQLPVNYYQIQTKFRDEIRPRFGVMRAREFLMKDAYSFHIDSQSLQKTYRVMFDAYSRIFTRLGLDFRAVQADSGAIGGNFSHEFHVLADSGEDAIAFSDSGEYAANVELAATLPVAAPRAAPAQAMAEVATPGVSTIAALTDFLAVDAKQCVKTLLVAGDAAEADVVALLVRGDQELNTLKAEKLPGVMTPLTPAGVGHIEALDSVAGFIGPVGLECPIYADHAVLAMSDFVCGANRDGAHLAGVNWERDLPLAEGADLRNVVDGDPSPDGNGTLAIARGIEVGHIFQLGDTYSRLMNAEVLDETGRGQAMQMGCYGIGITRIVAAAIEQNHDDRGIVWPAAMAPFDVALVPLNMHKSARLADAAEALYATLTQAGLEVIFDDRNARPGVKFADIELLGIPQRLVLSDKGLDAGTVEYKGRQDQDVQHLALDEVTSFCLGAAGKSP